YRTIVEADISTCTMYNAPGRAGAAPFDMEDAEDTLLFARNDTKNARDIYRQREHRKKALSAYRVMVWVSLVARGAQACTFPLPAVAVASIAAGLSALALILGLAYGLRSRRVSYKCPPGFIADQADMVFFVVGDWGRGGSESQRKVASMMAQLGGCYRPSFVVSTGDNFVQCAEGDQEGLAMLGKYESGLRGLEDPFFTQTFTDVYTDDSLMVPWYAVLGNHDYGELDREQLRLCSSSNFTTCPAGCCYSPAWQTNMSNRDWRWNARQGAWRQGFGNGLLDIVFVDTSPFVTKYHSVPWANIAGMSHCLGHSQHCSLSHSQHYNSCGINSQDWESQAALVQALLRNSTAKWKLVVGHHPIRSYGEHCNGDGSGDCLDMQWLRPVMKRYKAAAYFCGHEHDLQLIKSKDSATPPDPVYYVVSGAGSDIRTGEFANVEPLTLQETSFFADQGGFVAVVIKGNTMALHVWADRVATPAYAVDVTLPA
ncbi:hypothetical protein QJQ45_017357, partial [Haematococcus lacustris]